MVLIPAPIIENSNGPVMGWAEGTLHTIRHVGHESTDTLRPGNFHGPEETSKPDGLTADFGDAISTMSRDTCAIPALGNTRPISGPTYFEDRYRLEISTHDQQKHMTVWDATPECVSPVPLYPPRPR